MKSEIEISHNIRIKLYPDGGAVVLAATRPVFREPGWEAVRPSVRERSGAEHDNQNEARAMRRARAAVRDLARATVFSYFVTLTLDKEKIDRYDEDIIIRRLNVWLDNRVRRCGLTYVLVPEHHADGAIHFHGFFNDALPAVASGHFDDAGHEVYNLPSWDFGFSTAVKLYGDYEKAVSYVCKYIGKEGAKIGGRWYYSGGKLSRPSVVYADGDFDKIAAAEGVYIYSVPEAGAGFASVEVSAGGDWPELS